VTESVTRAQHLLNQWHEFRASRSCAHYLEMQEHKDQLESLAGLLTVGMYCSPTDPKLSLNCDQFESELDRFKQKVYQDLLSGLTGTHTK
jgi:hypothetical protein